jgi:hypothetical protein
MTVLGRVAAALLSTLVALDRAMAFFDLAYIPTRGRRNDVRHIERAEFSVDVRLNALGFREPRLPSPKHWNAAGHQLVAHVLAHTILR